MIVLVTVFRAAQHRDVVSGVHWHRGVVALMASKLVRVVGLGLRHLLVTAVAPLFVMRLGSMGVRDTVRQGKTGRREAGNQRQKESGPTGPTEPRHACNVHCHLGAGGRGQYRNAYCTFTSN
ncbi:MAG: hypothetical protein K2Y26_08670 [Gemmatimonadaceae bacterium]|nr:hypothetical protein [Gemmatimonadaceae bacterium]